MPVDYKTYTLTQLVRAYAHLEAEGMTTQNFPRFKEINEQQKSILAEVGRRETRLQEIATTLGNTLLNSLEEIDQWQI